MLQFDSDDEARAFAQCVTETALRRFRGMELFAKVKPYDWNKTPGENLKDLSKKLEEKKNLRENSFRTVSMGVEALGQIDFRPMPLEKRGPRPAIPAGLPEPPAGRAYPVEFADLAVECGNGRKDNFIAVIHIDGNAMGRRVDEVYQKHSEKTEAGWTACCAALQRFSGSIQRDFETAFRRTAERAAAKYPERQVLPIRPIILAGDDVCFVTSGGIGLECARIFMEQLTRLTNPECAEPYSSCAGVALVHQKYPFHQAYDLAEALCGSAKRFGSEIDAERRVSAIDWHIEFGQLKDSLSELRKEYETEDSGTPRRTLELRPQLVAAPDEVDQSGAGGVRTYGFFKAMCTAMQGEYGKIGRGKIKEFRTALKQGETESDFFLQDRQIGRLLYHGFDAAYRTESERFDQYRAQIYETGRAETMKKPFRQIGDTSRSLYFDAIELIDHFIVLEEVEG